MYLDVIKEVETYEKLLPECYSPLSEIVASFREGGQEVKEEVWEKVEAVIQSAEKIAKEVAAQTGLELSKKQDVLTPNSSDIPGQAAADIARFKETAATISDYAKAWNENVVDLISFARKILIGKWAIRAKSLAQDTTWTTLLNYYERLRKMNDMVFKEEDNGGFLDETGVSKVDQKILEKLDFITEVVVTTLQEMQNK